MAVSREMLKCISLARCPGIQRGQIEEVTGEAGQAQDVIPRLPYRPAPLVPRGLQSVRIVIPHCQFQFVAFDVNAPLVVNHDGHVDQRLLLLNRLPCLHPTAERPDIKVVRLRVINDATDLISGPVRPAGPVDRANLAEGHCATPERRACRSPRSPKMPNMRARVLSVSHVVSS